MPDPSRPGAPTRLRPGIPARALLSLALLALPLAGCGGAVAADQTAVAGAAVAVPGVDPVGLLDNLPDAATQGWELAGSGAAVDVTLDDIRETDPDRADRYAQAGFESGARLSLTRGQGDHIAVTVDRFRHAAAARQVEDWHVGSAGVTLDDGVSLVGTTAEGVTVLDDLLVRVVAIGEDAPDEDAVRSLLDATSRVVRPRA